MPLIRVIELTEGVIEAVATHQDKHFLTITLEGESIGSGRVPVPLLLRLLAEMNKALHRTGNVLQGEGDSVRRGPARKNIKEEIALDLVGITHGSPTAVLQLDRSQAQQSFDWFLTLELDFFSFSPVSF